MRLPVVLKYKKDGLFEYYKVAVAKEGKVEADVLIVPGELLDKHMKNSTKLPLMGCAIWNGHPDFPFKNTEMAGKNIIFIRDQVYKLMNNKEFQAIVEHELGHIVHENTTSSDTCYDKDEVLADAFMEEPERMKTLTKKWGIYNNETCKQCTTKMVMDNKTIENHWFLYCPKCGYWVGDGYLNMFYIEKLLCERLGTKMKYVPIQFRHLLNEPILTYEQNVAVEKMIAEAKKYFGTYGG